MRERHADVSETAIRFEFPGKGGKRWEVDVRDRRLARVVKRCKSLPGQHLFQYVDGDGEPRVVESGDVNDYLREISGEDFTAKDFRTWPATVLIEEIGEHAGHLPEVLRPSRGDRCVR
jgi:DNA topoisomerase I